MKCLGLFLLLCCISLHPELWAQYDGAPRADMEYYYRMRFLMDTTNAKRVTEDLLVLRTNGNISICFADGDYRNDSLWASDQKDKMLSAVMTRFATGGPRTTPDPGITSFAVLKDFAQGQLDCADDLGGEEYRYYEELPRFDWKITDEEKVIGEYTCQKAVCNFRGRTWIAWFTPELPVSDGPWKFHGLPGLILQAYDEQQHYAFKFLYMTPSAAKIHQIKQKQKVLSRKKFLKLERSFIKDPYAFASVHSGYTMKNKDGTRRKPRKEITTYAPLERY